MVEILTKISKETKRNDEIKVLNIIEQHAKESMDKVAKRCRLSRQKVWNIIKHLEEKKIIWGYSAIADGTLMDLKHYVLLVGRNTVPFDAAFRKEVTLENLDDYLPGSVKIENIFFTHGRFNAVITFYAPNLIVAKNFIQELFKRIGKYLGEYLLLETLFPIRKQGLKNPQIKELIEYL
jgi:DNA-binding Lrp family transcriptional regulator